MEILDGGAEGLADALALVSAHPNPAHMEEDRIVVGRRRGVLEMLEHSLAISAAVAYAIRGDDALVGGVTLNPAEGLFKHQLWLLGTAGSVRHPRWLVREGRRMLAAADRHFKWPYGYVQAIPEIYREGVNYARHMGFRHGRSVESDHGPILVMERMIPRWVQ